MNGKALTTDILRCFCLLHTKKRRKKRKKKVFKSKSFERLSTQVARAKGAERRGWRASLLFVPNHPPPPSLELRRGRMLVIQVAGRGWGELKGARAFRREGKGKNKHV